MRGVEINTLWPLISEPAMDYFREKGAADAFHFRMGPFRTDVDSEIDWAEIGGPYLLGPSGEWTPEWNPAFWQRVRELAWHAQQMSPPSHLEVVVVDSWACKHDQQGNHYMLWPQDAIDQCGKVWQPEHERYVRKVVEELQCMGVVHWALDNEFEGIHGHQTSWIQQMLITIRQAERPGCHLRIAGTSISGTGADYRITHAREPITVIGNQWSTNNERNPADPPAVDTQRFVDARNEGLGWALWRNGWSDAELEDALARRKAVVEGQPQPSACPKPLALGAKVYLNDKAYGHGFDSTVRVQGDPEFCRLIHGTPENDCHLEGWPQRSACEMGLMGGCPIWQCRTATHPEPLRCLQPADPNCSCDHWGTAGGAQDDPHTDAYEGMPFECGYQRVDGYPAAGFYAVVRGKGDVRACKPDGTGCGPWRFFDKSIEDQ